MLAFHVTVLVPLPPIPVQPKGYTILPGYCAKRSKSLMSGCVPRTYNKCGECLTLSKERTIYEQAPINSKKLRYVMY